MLDEKDLQAIAQLIDVKLQHQKEDIIHEVDAKLQHQKEDIIHEVDAKLQHQKEEIIHEVKVLLDTEVNTKFNLLAEEIQLLNQKVDALSAKDASPDVDVIKMAIKQLNWEIQQLKKAQ